MTNPTFDDPRLFLFAVEANSREEGEKKLHRVMFEKKYLKTQYEVIPANESEIYQRAFISVRDRIRTNGWRFEVPNRDPHMIEAIEDRDDGERRTMRAIFVVRLLEAKGRADESN